MEEIYFRSLTIQCRHLHTVLNFSSIFSRINLSLTGRWPFSPPNSCLQHNFVSRFLHQHCAEDSIGCFRLKKIVFACSSVKLMLPCDACPESRQTSFALLYVITIGHPTRFWDNLVKSKIFVYYERRCSVLRRSLKDRWGKSTSVCLLQLYPNYSVLASNTFSLLVLTTWNFFILLWCGTKQK